MAKTGCFWPFISTTTLKTTATCIIHITIHHCENTDATRPCPEGVSEQQSEPLDSEDKVQTSENKEDTDSKDIGNDFDL